MPDKRVKESGPCLYHVCILKSASRLYLKIATFLRKNEIRLNWQKNFGLEAIVHTIQVDAGLIIISYILL